MNNEKSVRALRAASKLSKIQREAHIVELRIEGYTCEKIGEILASEDGAEKPYSKQYISKCLIRYINQVKNQLSESVEVMFQLELMRLDMLHQVAYNQAIDDGNLAAIDRVLKIMERRDKLLGLDAASRSNMDNDDVSSRIVLYVPDNGRGPGYEKLEQS